MRGAFFIGLVVVSLIVGILVMKNMGVDDSSGESKTQAKQHIERAENTAEKAMERIKDISEQVSESK